ncbi:hypothetical protein NVS55_10125 [Myxococcus stipitatus]|uniref:hypothetical protein n=1 Tax=Myxococcus stipitatus TaxID=83455 RepID=UPI003145183C
MSFNAQRCVVALLRTVKARKKKYVVTEHLLSETRIDFRESFKQQMPSYKDSSGG